MYVRRINKLLFIVGITSSKVIQILAKINYCDCYAHEKISTLSKYSFWTLKVDAF